jgi:hypothetical protein
VHEIPLHGFVTVGAVRVADTVRERALEWNRRELAWFAGQVEALR